MEESADAESQELRAEKNEKCENDRAKAEDARLKAMEKLSETRKSAHIKIFIFPSDPTFHAMNICKKIFRFG